MNYETLNNNVVLVELTLEEMKRFDITYDLLNISNEKSKIAIKKILKEIPISSLNANSKIIVESLPIDDGGCFLIFTFKPNYQRYKLKSYSNCFYFKTNSLNDFLDIISYVKSFSETQEVCEILSFDNSYYLSLSEAHKPLFSLLKEFGTVTNSISTERLREFGNPLGTIVF